MFAGSDSALTDDEGELDAAKERCGGDDAIEVPAYVSPIAVVYNLQGVDKLNLVGRTIADIFAGKITKWNDPAIAKDNPGADLPSTTITPVHRSDDSGTTENFTDYLSQAGGGAWTRRARRRPGRSRAARPARAPRASSAAVKAGDGTIGYADESQAGDLGVAAIKVGSDYNKPVRRGRGQGARDLAAVEGRADDDMAIQVDRTTTESGAYPLLLTSYLIACQTYDNAADADLVKGYLSYVVSTEGQQAAADAGRLGAAGPAACQQQADGDRRQDRRRGNAAPRIGEVRRAGSRGRRTARRLSTVPRGSTVSATALRRRPERPAAPAPAAGDRVFAGLALAAGITILVALAGVFVFLAIEGCARPRRTAESTLRADHDFVGYVWPLVFGTAPGRADRADLRGAVRDRDRAVHLATTRRAGSPARRPT